MMKICTRCVLDSDIGGIRFDKNGICNICKIYDLVEKETKKLDVNKIIKEIKEKGKDKKYDCLMGISGGVDSTYLLYIAKKQFGLRPLVIHLDNEWNASISDINMKNTIEKLGVDFKKITINWEEFKDLQLAFLKASVPGVELPTDISIEGTFYKTAVENDISYIIVGRNYKTECKVPHGWGHRDGRYVKHIYKRFGTKKKLEHFSNITLLNKIYYTRIKNIKYVNLLDYINYDKQKAIEIIKKELNWKPYGNKHYESIYTRFVQAYLLPRKFGIDKRKSHFSSLIRSHQMTQEEALEELKKPPYSEEEAQNDLNFVLDKLGLSKEEWKKITKSPPKTFLDYPSYYSIIKRTPIWIIQKLISRSSDKYLRMILDELKYFEEDVKKHLKKKDKRDNKPIKGGFRDYLSRL